MMAKTIKIRPKLKQTRVILTIFAFFCGDSTGCWSGAFRERSKGHNNTGVQGPHVGSFTQNIQTDTLLTVLYFAAIFCCVPRPKSQAELLMFSQWPSALPNRKPSESGHFLSDPVCLLQPSFLPSPHFPCPHSHDVLQLSLPDSS